MICKIHNSFIFYHDNFGLINDYYQMIVDLIKEYLKNTPDYNINIILCDNKMYINNTNKNIHIDINWEHTLVKEGGRSILLGTPIGNIACDNSSNYLVRIDRFDELNNSDIIIDYSIPNIFNIKSSGLYDSFSNKHIYISSSIYDSSLFITESRSITTLTTFINTNEPRRTYLLNKINFNNIHHVNINNCFNKDSLQNLYKNTKILINIHQTDHHHTFEELRVLPALQCGVIIISEISPLSHLIPYNNFIIWETYDKIIDKTIEVINNYDYYFNLIFISNPINNINHHDMFNKNYNNLHDKLNSIL